MSQQPNYRESACCANCYHYASVMSYCAKHGGKVDFLGMCDTFATARDIEGDDNEI